MANRQFGSVENGKRRGFCLVPLVIKEERNGPTINAAEISALLSSVWSQQIQYAKEQYLT